jgi:hypothetical protein
MMAFIFFNAKLSKTPAEGSFARSCVKQQSEDIILETNDARSEHQQVKNRGLHKE